MIIFIIMLILRAKTRREFKGKIRTEFIKIGERRQYVNIVGEDKRLPVLIIVHGGPGTPISAVSHIFTRHLMKSFNIVNYDQRASGRSYKKGDTVCHGELVNDLGIIIDRIRKEYKENRIYLMGFSYGSAIALDWLRDNEHKVDGYIGVGQCVDMRLSYYMGAARTAHSAEEYLKLSGYIDRFYDGLQSGSKRAMLNYFRIEKEFKMHLACGEETCAREYFKLGLSAPDLSYADISWKLKQLFFAGTYYKTERDCICHLLLDFFAKSSKNDFNLPTAFISGEFDYTCPVSLVKDYIKGVSAPYKELFVIKNAGHSVMFDKPKEFAEAVISAVKNINKR